VKSLILVAVACSAIAGAQDTLVPIFDGKTLKGWQQCDGKATYAVEDGAIVGRTVEGSPNSFLCTTREYGDFILEFETKTDPALNSGVQIRAHKYGAEASARIFNGKEFVNRKFPAGRVYGYQVEAANEKSGASGGIYDEARRGWLHNISSDPAASKAFKDNQWNKYRIEARGDSIKVWVNGVPAADLVDPLDQSGFIGLQVHQFKGPHPTEVRWRNIRIQDLGRHAWKPIWNGKNMDGWSTRGGAQWTIENGAVHAKSTESEAIGAMVSDLSIKDATVRVLFKIASGNSGFFVRADHKTLAGYEVEIDAQKGTGGFWEVGGRRWVTGPEDNAAVKTDDWNELTASVHGDRIVFHLNGIKTVDLPKDTQGRKEGHIALQAHGAKRPTEVWFKDVAILQPAK
jgi:hypothetical protein